jgi:tetratricopeptide (TPR) repeat protein
MIVRDSARTLDACLLTISPWVNEKIIVDTGSSDNTRQIAERFGATVFELPWPDDFAAARNESLRHATGEWLFWMDSDDTISPDNGRKLRALADSPLERAPQAYVMQVHCPGPPESNDCTVVDHVKMFRNDPRLRFEGRIHEQILPAIRRNNGTLEWTDIYVSHSGAEHTTDAKQRKQQRDLRLLELDLAERPGHPFVLFNLGMTYADMDQPQTAAEYLNKCLLVSSPAESHVRKAYALLVGCLMQLNLNAQARQALDRSQELFPDDAELHFRRGILEQQSGNQDQAIAAYHAAVANEGERAFSSRDRGITGFKARHNLAGIYREIGRHDHAELQWRHALAEQPNYLDGWRGLVEILLEQKKYVTLELEVESAMKDGLSLAESACARAKVAAHRGNIASAIEILDDTISEERENIEPLRLKCQLLFESRPVDQAIIALEELCRRCPDDGAAWHNLGTACQKAGRVDVAIRCYEKSLAVRPGSRITVTQLIDARDSTKRRDLSPECNEELNEDGSRICPLDPNIGATIKQLRLDANYSYA